MASTASGQLAYCLFADDYKKATRAPKGPQGSAAGTGLKAQPWLSAEAREVTLERIQEFVDRALGLLEQERKAEVEAAGLATRSASPGDPASGPASAEGAAPVVVQGLPQRNMRKLLQLPQPGSLLGQPRSTVGTSAVLETVGEQEGEVEAEMEQAKAEMEQAAAALKGVVAVSSRIGETCFLHAAAAELEAW